MKHNTNKILLFKTNIHTAADMNILQPAFDGHPHIEKWTLDLDDDERILRVISAQLDHGNIIDMVRLNGYHCEELKD